MLEVQILPICSRSYHGHPFYQWLTEDWHIKNAYDKLMGRDNQYTTDNQGRKASTNLTLTTWNFKRAKDTILRKFREKFMTTERKRIRERDSRNTSQLMSQGDWVSLAEIQSTGPMRSVPYSAPVRLEHVCLQGPHTVSADPGVNGVLITTQASMLKDKKENQVCITTSTTKSGNMPGSWGSWVLLQNRKIEHYTFIPMESALGTRG